MSTCNQNAVVEPEPVVLYDKALLLCTEADVRNECTFMFKTINTDIIADSPLIFQPKFYQIQKDLSGDSKEDMPYNLQNTPRDFDDNLPMMQIFYENLPKDQPEYVDINNLTTFDDVGNKTPPKESIVISDDESDVIFVKEYKKKEERNLSAPIENNESHEDGVRRNPVRKARTNRGRRHLQNEHLLEEDFAFLDNFDEEHVVICKNQSSTSTNGNESNIKSTLKEWPINAFERPEYNPQTDKIEPFDYTIRDIQNKEFRKKPRLETCPKPKKKPKKKYIIRKRKPKSKKPIEKVQIEELKPVVTETLKLLSEMFTRQNSMECLYDLLKTQIAFMAVVNNYSDKDVSQIVSKLLSES